MYRVNAALAVQNRSTNRAAIWGGRKWGQPKESCINMGVHIGATWQIWLNDSIRWLRVDLLSRVVMHLVLPN